MPREASVAESPAAPRYAVSLLDEMAMVSNAGGPEGLYDRLAGVLRRRADEVTMTLNLMLPEGEYRTYVMNDLLLGMKQDRDTLTPRMGAQPPLHEFITLQSLRKTCGRCKAHEKDPENAPACPRQGQYHNIVYKTSLKEGTGREHSMLVAMGGTPEVNVECDVDPKTGLFKLTPLEAKKCLRQFGEYAIPERRRWKNKADRSSGDRWLVREPRHHELYTLTGFGNHARGDVQPMTDI